MGSYATGAQEKFLQTAHPVWLTKTQYEKWVHEVIEPDKYKEVTERYGDAPGHLLTGTNPQGEAQLAIAASASATSCFSLSPVLHGGR